jgi:predicted nucleic acid-binding protein
VAAASHPAGLIDTDILIDAERGHPDAVAFVTAQQAASGVLVGAVTAMELVVGCPNSQELAHISRSEI